MPTLVSFTRPPTLGGHCRSPFSQAHLLLLLLHLLMELAELLVLLAPDALGLVPQTQRVVHLHLLDGLLLLSL